MKILSFSKTKVDRMWFFTLKASAMHRQCKYEISMGVSRQFKGDCNILVALL